jgi:hypothetical protein
LVRREDVVRALEDIYAQVGSLIDIDECLREEARARLCRVVEIINMQDEEETVLEWCEADFDLLSEDNEAEFQEQLIQVLQKVEELEKEKGICRDEVLWDSMYNEHGIRRKRMARLVVKLTKDGLIKAVRPGCYRRVK